MGRRDLPMKMLTVGLGDKDIKYCSPCEGEAIGIKNHRKNGELNTVQFNNRVGYYIDYTDKELCNG